MRLAEYGVHATDRFGPSGDEQAALNVIMSACDGSAWMERQEDVIRFSGPYTLAQAKREYDVATTVYPESRIDDPAKRKRHFALAVLAIDVFAEMFAITERDSTTVSVQALSRTTTYPSLHR